MDYKVSRKEKRVYKDGPVDVVIDNSCDLYPILADDPRYAHLEILDKENTLVDVEVINNEDQELLDRAMFAVMKQRGNDPVEPNDGIQWAESVLGEVPATVIMQQVQRAVAGEGTGVQVTTNTIKRGGKSYLNFNIGLIR